MTRKNVNICEIYFTSSHASFQSERYNLSCPKEELEDYLCSHLSVSWLDSTSGLQVALDMQKEVTARREQVDSMQGRIQLLEDKMEKLLQVRSLLAFDKLAVHDTANKCLLMIHFSMSLFSPCPGETLPAPGDRASAPGAHLCQGGEETTRQGAGGASLQRSAAKGPDQ